MKEANFKETEIGKIPVDWELFTLKEISSVTRLAGYEYSKYWKETVNGEIIGLRGFNIGKNKIIQRDLVYISDQLSKKLIRSRLFINDIIYPCVGTIGNAVVISENDKYHIQQNIAKITPNTQKINPFYLSHFLMSDFGIKEIERFNGSSSQPNILVGSLRQYNIFFPPLSEQEKIAEVLSDTDLWIESTEALLAKKRQIKKGAMQKLLSPKEDWEVRKLGEMVSLAKSGGTPLSSNAKYYDGEIPFLSISDMTEQGKYLTRTSKSVSQEGIDNSASWVVPINSIIYSMYASVGFVSINKIEMATSQAVINLIFKPEYDLNYMYYFLTSIQIEVLQFVGEGTQKNLNAQTVKNLDIRIPKSLKTQQEIAEILSSMDLEIESLENRLQKARQLKQGMMQDLLTGKVRLIEN